MNNTVSAQIPNSPADELTRTADRVDAYLSQALQQRPLPDNLREAARYALLGGGKRLRPVLVVRACEAVGGATELALCPAAAIEMIHCFSLVHDDLPAMDDDDLRRGRATLHRHTSEAMAILTGDLLFGLAFELVATRMAPPELASRISRELAQGANDMIAGQVYDTLPQDPPDGDPMERLETIHRHKTGALIRSAVRMGAVCGRADPEQIEALTRFAEAIGLMFQIVDDLLDVTQNTEHLGKAAQKDAAMGKLTYPGVLGIERSRAEVGRWRDAAHRALTPLGRDAEPLGQLCNYLAVRQK